MGKIHFIRSGGIGGAGKTLFASMLIEYLRLHEIPCHSVNVGGDFLTSDENRAYSLIDLADKHEVIVDLPTHLEQELNCWVEDIAEQIQDDSVQVVDWFLHNMTRASWQAHLRQVAFWQRLNLKIPQIFLLNEHCPITHGYFPKNVKQICWDNEVALAIFYALRDVPLDDRPIGEIIDKSCYPHRKNLLKWKDQVYQFFKNTTLFKDQERLTPEYKPDMHPMEMLQIAKAHMLQNNLQPKQEPEKEAEAKKDVPW